jgi:hypothetical protein
MKEEEKLCKSQHEMYEEVWATWISEYIRNDEIRF